jgi:hypothetical protein
MNLQKFTLSTLTFSLVTALSVVGFNESASARARGGRYDKSNNVPTLIFDAFFEKDGSTEQIPDQFSKLDNIGVFQNSIIVDQTIFNDDVPDELSSLKGEAEVKGKFNNFTNLDNLNDNGEANLLAFFDETNKTITYQIYTDYVYQENDFTSMDFLDKPDNYIRFTPIAESNKNFVNDIKSIVDNSIPGTYGIGEASNSDFTESGSGILGLAINESIRFFNTEDANDFIGNPADDLKITQIGSRTTTTIPEPTTTLASLFVLGVSGISLRKRKKNDLI